MRGKLGQINPKTLAPGEFIDLEAWGVDAIGALAWRSTESKKLEPFFVEDDDGRKRQVLPRMTVDFA